MRSSMAAAQVEREGVVRDEKTGELLIPASQRPDGSWRKARRVRDGYIPQEEVPVFESKGTQWLKSRPTHPVGLAPEDVEKMERAKKAASDPNPVPVHTSKAAKKNAKRKEKKKQEQLSSGPSAVSPITKNLNQIDISKANQTAIDENGAETKTDLSKKLKNLKKKLKQIEDLENRIKSGELKNPETDQLEKISKKQMVLDEIEDIELELEES